MGLISRTVIFACSCLIPPDFFLFFGVFHQEGNYVTFSLVFERRPAFYIYLTFDLLVCLGLGHNQVLTISNVCNLKATKKLPFQWEFTTQSLEFQQSEEEFKMGFRELNVSFKCCIIEQALVFLHIICFAWRLH